MSKTLLRAAATLALAFLVLPLAACESKEIVVRIPDFDSAQVTGVRVWRLDDASGQWMQNGQIVFGETFLGEGREQVSYVNENEGAPSLEFQADLLRDPLNPDTVTLRLYYFRVDDPGEFRISTYNEAGESPLTLESTFL